MEQRLEVRTETRGMAAWMSEDFGWTPEQVAAAVAELGVSGDEKAVGRVIGHLMKSHGKDLDGALVNRLVREGLAGG